MIETIVQILRHADKGPDGKLTEKGYQDAFNYGVRLGNGIQLLYDGNRIPVTVITADNDRAFMTGVEIVEGLGESYRDGRIVRNPERYNQLDVTYTSEELTAIKSTEGTLFDRVRKIAPTTLQNDILNLGACLNNVTKETSDIKEAKGIKRQMIIAVTHSPTIEGMRYALTGFSDQTEDIPSLQGMIFTPQMTMINGLPIALPSLIGLIQLGYNFEKNCERGFTEYKL